jgi:chromosome segregation ATPase
MVNTRRGKYEIEDSRNLEREQLQTNTTLLTMLRSMVERNGLLIQEVNGAIKERYDELEEEHEELKQKYDLVLKRYKEKSEDLEDYKDRVVGYERAIQDRQKLQTDLECNSVILVLLFFAFIGVALLYTYYMNMFCKRV